MLYTLGEMPPEGGASQRKHPGYHEKDCKGCPHRGAMDFPKRHKIIRDDGEQERIHNQPCRGWELKDEGKGPPTHRWTKK